MQIIKQIFRKWYNVYTKPFDTLTKAKKKEGMGDSVKSMILGVSTYPVFAILGALLLFFRSSLPGEYLAYLIDRTIAESLVLAIIMFIGFFIQAGLLFGLAKMLGGKGSFEEHTSLLALCTAPFYMLYGVAIMLLGLLPAVGVLIEVLLLIYYIFLVTLCLKISHGYDWGRAVLTWMLPSFVIILLITIAYFMAVSAYFNLLLAFQSGL